MKYGLFNHSFPPMPLIEKPISYSLSYPKKMKKRETALSKHFMQYYRNNLFKNSNARRSPLSFIQCFLTIVKFEVFKIIECYNKLFDD